MTDEFYIDNDQDLWANTPWNEMTDEQRSSVLAASAGKNFNSDRHVSDAIQELASCALALPELRLCQLIVNATGKSDPFYVTDADLALKLKQYRVQHAEGRIRTKRDG